MAIQEAVGMMSRDPNATQGMSQQNETQGLNVNPQEFEVYTKQIKGILRVVILIIE